MTLILVRFPRVPAAVLLSLVATGCFDPESPSGDTDAVGESSSSTSEDPSVDPTASTSGSTTSSATSSSSTTEAGADSSSSSSTGSDVDTDGYTETDTDTDGDSDTGEPLPVECDDGIAAPGEVCFGDAAVFNAGDIGHSPRAGNVGGDESVDLVYLSTDQIIVRLGDGTGGFGPELMDETIFCSQMELADVDGDGNLDVVGIVGYQDFLTVALGNGTGSFTLQAPSLTVGANPVQLVAGSLDGDEHADVITIHGTEDGGTGGGRSLASNGAGGFELTDYFSTASQAGRDVTMGDFTGNGILDVAYTLGGGNDRVRIAINDGTGEFGQSLGVNVAALDPTGIVAGDLNGDGDDDLAIGNGDDILVLLGTGTASFMPAISLPAAGHATFVAIEDVTNDGVGDVVAIYDDTMAVSVFPSLADGTFGERVDLSIGVASDSLSLGDVNEDGVPDLITGSTDDELVTILLSTP